MTPERGESGPADPAGNKFQIFTYQFSITVEVQKAGLQRGARPGLRHHVARPSAGQFFRAGPLCVLCGENRKRGFDHPDSQFRDRGAERATTSRDPPAGQIIHHRGH